MEDGKWRMEDEGMLFYGKAFVVIVHKYQSSIFHHQSSIRFALAKCRAAIHDQGLSSDPARLIGTEEID